MRGARRRKIQELQIGTLPYTSQRRANSSAMVRSTLVIPERGKNIMRYDTWMINNYRNRYIRKTNRVTELTKRQWCDKWSDTVVTVRRSKWWRHGGGGCCGGSDCVVTCSVMQTAVWQERRELISIIESRRQWRDPGRDIGRQPPRSWQYDWRSHGRDRGWWGGWVGGILKPFVNTLAMDTPNMIG